MDHFIVCATFSSLDLSKLSVNKNPIFQLGKVCPALLLELYSSLSKTFFTKLRHGFSYFAETHKTFVKSLSKKYALKS